MSLIAAIILGLVQGLTEFIPVSSSGHLVIAQRLLNVSDAGLTFDVALHIGTLLALVIFFHRDIIKLARGILKKTEDSRLAWLIALATVPAVLAGMWLQDSAETSFRSVRLVALTMISMALVMIVAEHFVARRQKHTKLQDINSKQALTIGFAQALALIPGISRSGSTITAGIFSGLSRVSAMRFSFLLAIPITFGAILKVVFFENSAVDLIGQNQGIFIAGILSAAVSGLLAIKFLLKFLANHSLHTFAYYRIVIGILALTLL